MIYVIIRFKSQSNELILNNMAVCDVPLSFSIEQELGNSTYILQSYHKDGQTDVGFSHKSEFSTKL